MASWKLKVEDYGKIKQAEIEMAPFMLFVGDNNSGKSYLLSLLWGIQNIGIAGLIGRANHFKTQESAILETWLMEQIRLAEQDKKHEVSLAEIREPLETVLNDSLDKYKNKLVTWIFNSQEISIGHIEIKLGELDGEILHFIVEDKFGRLSMFTDGRSKFHLDETNRVQIFEQDSNPLQWFMIGGIYSCILGVDFRRGKNENIYFPAARTGFMLTKDIINKAGRDNTFNISEEKEDITPFTRPINQFLDVMGDLTAEKKGKSRQLNLAYRIEEEIADGTVDIDMMPNKEVLYIPNGKKKGMPLRLVSAVVTELSPLVLILKHKEKLGRFYYEEPEMCLHPQLQQKMGKILGRIVNSGIGVTVTTHSDLILQHVNNMIKLARHPDHEEICEMLGYDSEEFLSPEQVRVYQFESGGNRKTNVKELPCGENGFVVETFNHALEKIMDEAYRIQE